MLIKSEDRTYGTNFDFQVNLLASSANIRKIQLAKCILPLLPQVNVNNKTVTVTHVDGTVTFPLIEGYYSVQSYVNMLQTSFSAAWLVLDPTNTVTISYDIERRSILISDDNSEAFYIHNDCTFALYSRNVVFFQYEAAGSTPTTTSIESLSLNMIYSRYVILESQRLTEDQKSYSMISGKGASNIVSIIDIASKYNEAQFVVSSSFPGTLFVIDTLDYSPLINVLNRNKSLKVIDFVFVDEFGFNLSNISTSSFKFEYPTCLWFQCYL
jgi:hypothetical protein